MRIERNQHEQLCNRCGCPTAGTLLPRPTEHGVDKRDYSCPMCSLHWQNVLHG